MRTTASGVACRTAGGLPPSRPQPVANASSTIARIAGPAESFRRMPSPPVKLVCTVDPIMSFGPIAFRRRNRMIPTRRAAVAAALLCVMTAGGAALAAPAPAGPRPLTEAERQGVVFAAEYLERGPAAWWDHLSRTSPLRRLGREAALAEIEVRAGSPAEAQWELQAAAPELSGAGAVFGLQFPSGLDDTLILGLVQEGGAWKIDTMRISAEPATASATLSGLADGREVKPVAPAPALALPPV